MHYRKAILSLVFAAVPLLGVQASAAQEQHVAVSSGTVHISAPETPPITSFAQAAPSWEVAFVSDRDGNPEIYAMNADGSNQHRLTNDPALDGAPAWSPDGSLIAFHSDRGGNLDIYVMNADGSDVRRLTNDPGSDTDPAWSPDGCQIVFVSERDGNPEIYTMNADGSNLQRFTNDPAVDTFPAWSPDNKQIAFSSNRSGAAEIYVMEAAAGSPAQVITNLAGANGWYPAWSPDSSLLSFTVEAGQQADLYTMSRQGQNITKLTPQPGTLTLTDWSPDGQWLAFTGTPNGNKDVMVMDAQGKNLSSLTHDPADDYDPDWRPPVLSACTVRTDQKDVWVFVGPGYNRSVFAFMPVNLDIPVIGQATDSEGNLWWEIDKTAIDSSNQVNSLWVLQSDVQASSSCALVCTVPPSPILAGATPVPSGGWGACGSCQTCGYTASECVTSPDGKCVWDPATCANVPPVPTSPPGQPTCLYISTSVEPPGTGSIVFRYPPNCGQGGYNPGSAIVMVASPNTGYGFWYWSGTCPITDKANPFDSFTITGSCSIVAHFK